MSETETAPQIAQEDTGTANIIYILSLSSLVLGITAIIGVIMAYVNRKESADWLQTHYTFQIHTFWKGMLYFFIGMILTMVLIGIFVIFGTMIWMIIRNVKGMKALSAKQPIENPKSWWL